MAMNEFITPATWAGCAPTIASTIWAGKDFQAERRGYRVEAGEIETLLLAQDNVKEAVVATCGTRAGVAHDGLSNT